MNVFSHIQNELAQRKSNFVDFVPKPATGELMNDQTPYLQRIEIMAARVERGEEVFHPSELKIIKAIRPAAEVFTDGRGQGISKITHHLRPSKHGANSKRSG